MNEKIGFALSGLVLCIGFSLSAQEMPYAEGRVVELAPETGIQEVRSGFEKTVTFLRDENGAPTSIRFTEEGDGATQQTWDFVISKKNPAGCGSQKLEGIEEATPGNPLTLEVIDHSDRRCDDYRPYQWEMILKEKGRQPRHLVASPEDISILQ